MMRLLEFWKAESVRFDAICFDIDGTLVYGPRALPGAVELIELLRRDGTPFLFLTNDGDHTRKFLACIAPMCKGCAPDALQAYYDEYIYGVENFGEFLQKIGVNQLLAVKAAEAHHCERLA